MPNQHSLDKVCIGAWVSRGTAQALRKLAKRDGITASELYLRIYEHATKDISLTKEDYALIEADRLAAERRKDRRLKRK